MPLTEQQEAVLEAVRRGADHLNVGAVAGSGKTFTGVQAYRLAGTRKAGFVAYNKHIAAHLRTEHQMPARTLHSLGMSACIKAGCQETDEKKLSRTILRMVPEWACRKNGAIVLQSGAGYALRDLVRLAKQQALPPETPAASLAELLRVSDIEKPPKVTDEEIGAAAARVLAACAEDARSHDFDDMLWLPLARDWTVESFDLLFVDEAQDLNPAQRELALRAGDGQTVIIGDVNQSIYAFTGADPDSIPKMRSALALRGRVTDSPLTVTFRCPISHVRLAQRLVPEIRAVEGAPEGCVDVVSEEQMLGGAAPGDIILARRNAPLVEAALRLISAGKRARMIGRDIGKDIEATMRRIGGSTPVEVLDRLRDWQDRQAATIERQGGDERKQQSLRDRCLCVRYIAARFETLSEVVQFLASLGMDDGQDDAASVRLSSIHRAKGLEADRVWITDTDCLPLRLSCKACGGTGDIFCRKTGPLVPGDRCPKCLGSGSKQTAVEQQQERNLAYVAVTRAKRSLFFVGKIPAIFA